MGLRELDNLKPNYNSDRDDVLNQFYIPALKESIEYYRLAGFFSSTALAVAARGVMGLLKNGGRIKLIAGAIINPEDVNAIRDGLEKPINIIEQNFIKDLNNIEDEFVRNHIQALGWMVANNKMDIRLAVLKGDDGLPLDSQSMVFRGIFHPKIGIFKDNENNMISFSGSINETGIAWRDNIEQFKVFRKWIEGESENFAEDCNIFSTYWNGNAKRIEIIDIPEAIRKNLLKFSTKNIDDIVIDYDSYKSRNGSTDLFDVLMKADINKLRDYQREALENWKRNNYKGILEMATASGKTFTAIMGSYFLFKRIGKLATIVLVPSRQLVKQWGEELRKYTQNVALISSDIRSWKSNLEDYIYLFNRNRINNLYIITTIPSYIQNAEKILSKISPLNKLLIIDEAHWIGAEVSQDYLKQSIPIYILGLTATPIRYYDEEGTRFLKDYLGNVIFRFSIEDGQKRGYLCKYNYYIDFCKLNSIELRKYIELTRKIIIASNDINKRDNKKYEALLNRRAKIIKDAESKFLSFERIIANLENLDKCIVYCDENQIERVCDILQEYDIRYNTFLGGTTSNERQILISRIKSGSIDAIVAIKCLNEGVDIPPLKIGFFISNSGNPREFIQRRGRLLRTSEGKTIVHMYDFVVIPDLGNVGDVNGIRIDNIIETELKRVKEFNDNALNKAYNEGKILEILNKVI